MIFPPKPQRQFPPSASQPAHRISDTFIPLPSICVISTITFTAGFDATSRDRKKTPPSLYMQVDLLFASFLYTYLYIYICTMKYLFIPVFLTLIVKKYISFFCFKNAIQFLIVESFFGGQVDVMKNYFGLVHL